MNNNSEQRLIVPITDCVDVAYNEMRAAVVRHSGLIDIAHFIEPVVPVHPFSITNASFIVRLMAEAYSSRGILYTIVNPIPTQPERIIGRTVKNNIIFSGRNNGVFGWLVDEWGCAEVYEIPDPGYIPFGGKHIYPSVIAAAWNGVPLSELGKAMSPDSVRSIYIADGTVVHIDNFGIAKIKLHIDFRREFGVSDGDDINVYLNDEFLCRAKYSPRLMSLPSLSWGIYSGSSLGGLVELGIARGNASAVGNIGIGDIISLRTGVDHGLG